MDPRTERTKALMREALAEMLRHKTLDDITVSDIVKESRIARTTFYHYYQDIRAIR
ncbi:MAG: TetR family transcriptional regulator [Lachnospiraceae bacterium]|nr:TetR family transcriptional regulator [Lachnospiraceae bacterium]